MNNPPSHGPLPLVVGVTGHRDLRPEDRPALEGLVRDIFDDLRKRCPTTPILLLSSLAEGADRLVARVALDAGARLVVPLPLPQEEYEKDFTTPESRAEFAELLRRAEQVLELPLVEGNTPESIREPSEPRNRQYGAAGAHLARHSQILIALWDGVEAAGTGGTAQIVHFQLDGVPPPYAPPRNPLDPPQSGPVYHILTPRQSNPNPNGPALTLQKRYPVGLEPDAPTAAYERVYARMDTFNRDAVRLSTPLADYLTGSENGLLPADAVASLPSGLRQFLACFARADVLAIHFQRAALRVLMLLLAMVFLAAFFTSVADPLNDALWGRVLYVVMLGMAYLVLTLAAWADFESRYLDYRALAEGMRVQLFWRLAGLSDSVADHYLRKQRSVLDWIRDAVRVWNLGVEPDRSGKLDLVLTCWVRAQHAYYVRAAHRDRWRLAWLRGVGHAFFVAGILWAIGKIALGSVHPRIDALGLSFWQADLLHMLVVLVSLAPILAALLYGYAKTRALSEHAQQYTRMAQLFARAEELLSGLLKAGRSGEARQLVLDLGKEALMENSDWVQLHRERPMQVPR